MNFHVSILYLTFLNYFFDRLVHRQEYLIPIFHYKEYLRVQMHLQHQVDNIHRDHRRQSGLFRVLVQVDFLENHLREWDFILFRIKDESIAFHTVWWSANNSCWSWTSQYTIGSVIAVGIICWTDWNTIITYKIMIALFT